RFSDDLYYTTRTTTEVVDLVEQLAALDQDIMLSPYFDYGSASLHRIDRESREDTLLLSGDEYAYARLVEAGDGSIFYSTIENHDELYQAMNEGMITAENWREFLPDVTVMRMGSESNAQPWLEDARQFALFVSAGE